MYAIVQNIDGYVCVVGHYHCLYADLEEAKKEYAKISYDWYTELAKALVAGGNTSWSENPPLLYDISSWNVVMGIGDKKHLVKQIYEEYWLSLHKTQEECTNQSKALQAEYERKLVEIVLS